MRDDDDDDDYDSIGRAQYGSGASDNFGTAIQFEMVVVSVPVALRTLMALRNGGGGSRRLRSGSCACAECLSVVVVCRFHSLRRFTALALANRAVYLETRAEQYEYI